MRHRASARRSGSPAANEGGRPRPQPRCRRVRAECAGPETLAERSENGGLRAAGAGRAASGGRGRRRRRLEEAGPSATTYSGVVKRRRVRPWAAAAMQRRRRAPPGSQPPQDGGCGEDVEVQFSSGRLGSAAPAGPPARGTTEDEERLEREHFWKVINAFRYYG